ncbi:DUF221-domain-containing protein [Schizophyllum commune Tattone D]|nr:DUF221-domain-containing protein [Schizophyllum commune Tattone D]
MSTTTTSAAPSASTSTNTTDISNAKAASTDSFVTALVFNAIVFGAEIGVFTVLRPWFRAIYEPRTYVPPPSKRSPTIDALAGLRRVSNATLSKLDPRTLLAWPIAVYKADAEDIIPASGLDAYLFVRFLRMLTRIFAPIWIISWLVLLPLDAVGGSGDGLERFTFGNVSRQNTSRYWAHLILAWVFTIHILRVLTREMGYFVRKRQQFLVSKAHAGTAQAATILVTGVPASYLTEDALWKLFRDMPGGVKKMWINRDLGSLPDAYDEQVALCAKLESAETELVRNRVKARMKAQEKLDKEAKKGKGKKGKDTDSPSGSPTIGATNGSSGNSSATATDPLKEAELAVPRPTHRLGFLGLWGEKVDTIDYCRKEIARLEVVLEEGRARLAAINAASRETARANIARVKREERRKTGIAHPEDHFEVGGGAIDDPGTKEGEGEKGASMLRVSTEEGGARGSIERDVSPVSRPSEEDALAPRPSFDPGTPLPQDEGARHSLETGETSMGRTSTATDRQRRKFMDEGVRQVGEGVKQVGKQVGTAGLQVTRDVGYAGLQAGKDMTRDLSSVGKQVGEVGKHVGKQALGLVGLASKDDSYPPLNSAFVTFQKQIGAHMAAQVLLHHEPYRMSKTYIEMAPDDVIWSNLGMNPYEARVRIAISWAATGALIVFWAFPVAFVGSVSNIYTLCGTVKWLTWICDLPTVVTSIISGILPPVALAILMALLPVVLRLLARFEGVPRYSGLELSLMTRYFIFQVVHSFLVVTLSSGIIASLEDLLNNPTSIPNLLASNLPSASNFFLTYVILQGLSGTAAGFLQIVPLALYYVKLFVLGSTPRAVYGIKYELRNVAWGTLFPGITLLSTIAIGYSIISPIINGLACFTFFAFYELYKYLFLWQLQQSPASDTGGLFFPKAIQHVFVGMYVQQVCLCALFFLVRDDNHHAKAVPQGALMVVLIILTAFYNLILTNSYGPLLSALPLSLKDKTFGYEEDEDEVAENATNGKRKSTFYQAAETEKGVSSAVEPRQIAGGEKRRTTFASDGQNEKDVSVRDFATGDVEAGEAGHAYPPSKVEDQGAPRVFPQPKSADEYGFAHPAASRPQRTVWIPADDLGHGEEEARACREAGVNASTHDAIVDPKGKVDILGPPPDVVRED